MRMGGGYSSYTTPQLRQGKDKTYICLSLVNAGEISFLFRSARMLLFLSQQHNTATKAREG